MRLLIVVVICLFVTKLTAQTYVVGITENMPLKSFDENMNPTGIFVDLLNYIAEKEDWELEYIPLEFQECMDALEAGEIDIMPDLGYSEERSEKYQFNKIDVCLAYGQIFTNEDNDIKTILDLNNKKIAMVKNDLFYHDPVDGFAHLIKKFNLSCDFVYAKDYDDVFNLIELKQADAGIVNRIYGDYRVANNNYHLKKTPVIFSPVHLHFAFPKNDKYDALIQKIDQHLKTFKNDNNSFYYKLFYDYFNVRHVSRIPNSIKIVIVILIGITLISLLFIFILNRAVKIKTKELKLALERARESDHLKTTFLRNLSHEVRTPMNGINGFALMLQEDGHDLETRQRFTELILSSSKQLLSIVDNILTVSLLETKQEKPELLPVNINDLLDELYDVYSKSLDEKNVQFTIDKELDKESAVIQTDKTKLYQILSNLLSNAVKFTSRGFIRFGYIVQNGNIEFFVQDSGIGIDFKLKEQIFALFSQEDNSNKRRYGGAGLGLSIAKGYVELLGGQIWFYSEKQNPQNNYKGGTTFYFTIPIPI